MPYPNEHSARLHSPQKYAKFARQNDKLGPGISVIFGIDGTGKSEIQALRFDASKFTAQEARHWLRKNHFKVMQFEPASPPKKKPAET